MLLHSRPPYNFAGIWDAPSVEKARVVVLPVPYDSTVSWRGGARDGPHAIISASRNFEWWDAEMRADISKVGIATLDELEPDMSGPEKTIMRVEEAVGEIFEKKKFPVMLGGEHSICIGGVRAASKHFKNLSVLQLDAHADMRDEYEGTKFNHACGLRRVREACDSVVQVGIRSLSEEEAGYIEKNKLKVYYWNKYNMDEIMKNLKENVYITLDIDVLDPAEMPSVGTPEPGGLHYEEVLAIVREVAKRRRVVGFDLCELAPIPGFVAPDYLAAKMAYKMIGYSLLGGK